MNIEYVLTVLERELQTDRQDLTYVAFAGSSAQVLFQIMVSTAWVLMLQTIAFSLLSLHAVNNLFPSLSLLPGMYLESVIPVLHNQEWLG